MAIRVNLFVLLDQRELEGLSWIIKKWGEQRKNTTLGKIAFENPETLAFVGIMGSIGLDLTPFGGLEKNAFKKEKIFIAKNLSQASKHLREFAKKGDVILYENDLPDFFEKNFFFKL